MKIRKLKKDDSARILEWMRDSSVNRFFRFESDAATPDSVMEFIEKSQDDTSSCHLAVAGDDDVYMGTVSLKNIDLQIKSAEYAISMHPDAIGAGYARFATTEILRRAFGHYGLKRVYLNVLSDNIRAIRFYTKYGFEREGEFHDHIMLRGKPVNLTWFRMTDGEFDALSGKPGAKEARIINLKVMADERGKLVATEANSDIPFDIKRIFYIFGVSGGEVRGLHSNRRTEFVLICLCGGAKVKLHDGKSEHVYTLDRPDTGLYIPKGYWKEMYDFSPDCVMLAICSEHYDPSEYVRNFNAFLREAGCDA